MSQQLLFAPMEKGAQLSEDGKHRYLLVRAWELSRPRVCWVGLNPSIANAEIDDNTVRKIIGYSRREGFGSLAVVNLYSWRATDPDEMWAARAAGEAIDGGKENLTVIHQQAQEASAVVAAWGGDLHIDPGHVDTVCKVLGTAVGRPLQCLKVNADGSPGHPLYLANALRLKHWRRP